MSEAAAEGAKQTVQVHLPKGLVLFLVQTVRSVVENGLRSPVEPLLSDSRGRARLLAVLLPLVHAAARRLALRRGQDQLHTQATIAGLSELAWRELGGDSFPAKQVAELGDAGSLTQRFRQWYGAQPALMITIDSLLERYEFSADFHVDAAQSQQLTAALAGLATTFADGDQIARLAGMETGAPDTAH